MLNYDESSGTAAGDVYDATIGPITGTPIATYLASAIDFTASTEDSGYPEGTITDVRETTKAFLLE